MRKMIFISIVLTMILCFAGFIFVPEPPVHQIPIRDVYEIKVVSPYVPACDSVN